MTGRQEATPNTGRQTVGRRLRERQRNLRSYANHDIEARPKITQTITEADKSVSHRNFVSGVQAWKVCSGIAHANMSVIRAVLERVPVGNPDSSGISFQLTSRVTLIAALLGAAVENLGDTIVQIRASLSAASGTLRAFRKPGCRPHLWSLDFDASEEDAATWLEAAKAREVTLISGNHLHFSEDELDLKCAAQRAPLVIAKIPANLVPSPRAA
ncbi:hypothetical protein DM791_04000 [Paenarthrobacter nitroguajacolicus]|nr:hypothetical protein [Paenarthrobacter nitroguajacolicus]